MPLRKARLSCRSLVGKHTDSDQESVMLKTPSPNHDEAPEARANIQPVSSPVVINMLETLFLDSPMPPSLGKA